MIQFYLKNSLRKLKNLKIDSVINIIGISIGISVSFFISVYVINELSYNSHHQKKDELYRLIRKTQRNENLQLMASSQMYLGPKIKEELPEIISSTRIIDLDYKRLGPVYLKKGMEMTEIDKFRLIDPDLFNIFSYRTIYGNKPDFFKHPNSIVITENASKKYFNEKNPIGESIEIIYKKDTIQYTVAGVVKALSNLSTIDIDFFAEIGNSFKGLNYSYIPDKASLADETYLLLDKNTDPKTVEQKLQKINYEFKGVKFEEWFSLQPLNDIYLKSGKLADNLSMSGDITKLQIVGMVALLILIIAVFNYVMLSKAKSLISYKEYGLKKLFGAKVQSLKTQFLFDSITTILISLPLITTIFYLLYTKSDFLLGKKVTLEYSAIKLYIIAFILLTILTSLIISHLVAFSIKQKNLIDLFQRVSIKKVRKLDINKILITVQIAVFLGVTICTFTIHNQIKYTQTKDYGFNKDNLLILNIKSSQAIKKDYEYFKKILSQNPTITEITGTSWTPPSRKPHMKPIQSNMDNSKILPYHLLNVDYDFLQTYQIPLIEGRVFSKSYGTDKNSILLNESAIKKYNLDSPIGKELKSFGNKYKIIGIVKDFDLIPIDKQTPPLLIALNPEKVNDIAIRFTANQEQNVIEYCRKCWNKIDRESPFSYSLLSDNISQLYQKESQLSKMAKLGSLASLLILGLGLFGISFFYSLRSSKEIAIRTLHGAKFVDLITNSFRNNFWLIVVACIIAFPPAFLIMDKWLSNYANHVSTQIDIYILVGIFATLIVFGIYAMNIFRISNKQSITESLKYE